MHRYTLKNTLLALIILPFFTSCLTNEVKEPVQDQQEEPKPNPKIILEDKDITDFTVAVNGKSPRLLSQLTRHTYNFPLSPYGMTPPIDFVVNDNNTIDIFWIDAGNTKYLSRISMKSKSVVKNILLPIKINNSPNSNARNMGFESIGENKFIVGFGKDNSFGNKSSEAWYVAFDDAGTELFSTRLWGEEDVQHVGSKSDPGQAGSAVIKYSPKNNTIAIYLAHTEKFPDKIRHQAGWFGFLDATTGEILKKGDKNIGNSWYMSHNFDQRCILTQSNEFYALGQGDAFPRALVISRWNDKEGWKAGLHYHDIQNKGDGTWGKNQTFSTTGDLIELTNGNVAIVYSTKDGRGKRDLKLVIVGGMQGEKPNVLSEMWITELKDAEVGWGSKLIQYNANHILLGWNTFTGNRGEVLLKSHIVLTDLSGKIVSNILDLPSTVLYPAQSFKKSADGKSIIFVSGEAEKLKVYSIAIKEINVIE